MEDVQYCGGMILALSFAMLPSIFLSLARNILTIIVVLRRMFSTVDGNNQ